jgi:hypothetical protein
VNAKFLIYKVALIWEAGILPLNYSRLPYFSSTYLFLKNLGRSTASLFRLLRPSKTMGFDRKMDSKVDSKLG